MLQYDQQKFIELVLEYKYAAQEDIDKCLEIQKKLPVSMGIGEILRGHQYLSDQKYRVIMTLLKYKIARIEEDEKDPTSSSSSDQTRVVDRKFAELAIQEGLINEENLKKCVQYQKEMKAQGHFVPISSIAVEKGYMAAADVAYIQEGRVGKTSRVFKGSPGSESIPVHSIPKQVFIPGAQSANVTCLVVIHGEGAGKIFPLNKGEVTIGRVKGADIQISDSFVSRIHCKMISGDESKTWEIVDMMSTHGVFVNENRVQGRCSLNNGDRLQVGKTVMEFRG